MATNDIRASQVAARVVSAGAADVRVSQTLVRVIRVLPDPDVAGLSLLVVYTYDEATGAKTYWGIPWQ